MKEELKDKLIGWLSLLLIFAAIGYFVSKDNSLFQKICMGVSIPSLAILAFDWFMVVMVGDYKKLKKHQLQTKERRKNEKNIT
ncbi:MAG: hypothetical protein PHE43_04065 [Candidatus Nanoarchaeia archaeon]|nr:hypothetical protein [Candidatus Nanoarchaeia archaeon]